MFSIRFMKLKRVNQLEKVLFIIFIIFLINYFISRIEILVTPISLNESNEVLNSLDITERDFDFDEDVLAFMHIQKTSGTNYENMIFSNLMVNRNNSWQRACIYDEALKSYNCFNNSYKKPFFWDRYHTRYLDIHSDYCETKTAILYDYGDRIDRTIKNTPFYGVIHIMTMIRDPVSRYISEFRHVKRNGIVWQRSVRVCKNEALYVKKCVDSNDWTNATWYDFLNCEYNQANNRQTRMLADYEMFGCRVLKCWSRNVNCTKAEKELNERVMLQSAKQTLLSLSFFGLTEYQQLSQYLFEKTFKDKMKFSQQLIENKKQRYETSEEYKSIDMIKENNHLDIQLYNFAKYLFFKRIEYFRNKDSNQRWRLF